MVLLATEKFISPKTDSKELHHKIKKKVFKNSQKFSGKKTYMKHNLKLSPIISVRQDYFGSSKQQIY